MLCLISLEYNYKVFRQKPENKLPSKAVKNFQFQMHIFYNCLFSTYVIIHLKIMKDRDFPLTFKYISTAHASLGP